MKSKAAKVITVADLQQKLANAKSAIIVDYRGLTVAQITDLRRKLREVGGELVVAKNTLVARAIETDATIRALGEALNGPTAVVFGNDEVASPKVVLAFAKNTGLPSVKGGLLSDRVLTIREIQALATIPGREVLSGQLVNLLAGGPQRLVWVLNGNLTKLAMMLEEIRKKKA
jgi:large subunit ribosomal protein L10